MRSFLDRCREHDIDPFDEIVGLSLGIVLLVVGVTGWAAIL